MICHNCKNRRIGCHAECADYAAFRVKRAEFLKKRERMSMLYSYRAERIEAMQKRRGRER